MGTQEWLREGYICSTDKSRLQYNVIHSYLSERSYWAKGRTVEKIQQSIEHSECFGLYKKEKQIGFARVVSDFAIFAYILDVFVLEEERGLGHGKFIMECILNHPDLKEVNKWMLGTDDAHGLYAQYGFTPIKKVQNLMERVCP